MRDVRLVPTPLADVGPLGFDPPWRAELTSEQDAADWWRSQPVMPVCGEVIERGGVRLQPVSFCTWEPTGQVMVHLNSLTDAHRTDIRPALLEPVAGSALRVRSYLLPADGRSRIGSCVVRSWPSIWDASAATGWRCTPTPGLTRSTRCGCRGRSVRTGRSGSVRTRRPFRSRARRRAGAPR